MDCFWIVAEFLRKLWACTCFCKSKCMSDVEIVANPEPVISSNIDIPPIKSKKNRVKKSGKL